MEYTRSDWENVKQGDLININHHLGTALILYAPNSVLVEENLPAEFLEKITRVWGELITRPGNFFLALWGSNESEVISRWESRSISSFLCTTSYGLFNFNVIRNIFGGGKCTCTLWDGCSCGAFAAEMKSLGRVFDPLLGCWVSK